MASERIKCGSCGTRYTIEWDEDDMVDYMEPEFCPFCGVELASCYDDQDWTDEDYE